MAYDIATLFGLSTQWDSATGFSVSKNISANTVELNQDLTGSNNYSTTYKAAIPSFNIFVNGNWSNKSTEEYLLFVFKEVTYFPLTWRFGIEFGLNLSWSNLTELSIISNNTITNWVYGGYEAIYPYKEYEIKYANGVPISETIYIGTYWICYN